MAMAAPIPMPIDPTDILRLTQWLSPSFPVSAYAYSHGLEAAIARGDIRGANDLEAWITSVLEAGAGRNDAILLGLAHGDEMAFGALCDLAEALAGARERLEETRAQGHAFALTLTAIEDTPLDPAPYPVAIGIAARRLSLPRKEVIKLYLHAFASNLVSVAVRFVPLGQSEGQMVLSRLHEVIAQVAIDAAVAGVDDLGGCVFGADLAAMEHEDMEVRIFRT